jgi:hypothetical protein
MNFRVGQKVVCVDARGLSGKPWAYPKKGEVYTVDGYAKHWMGGEGVVLREVVNIFRGSPQPFAASRFRPVVDRKTDISTFTKILDDVNAGRVRELAS